MSYTYDVTLEDKHILLSPKSSGLPVVEVQYSELDSIDKEFLKKTFILANAKMIYDRLKSLSPTDSTFVLIEREIDKWLESNQDKF